MKGISRGLRRGRKIFALLAVFGLLLSAAYLSSADSRAEARPADPAATPALGRPAGGGHNSFLPLMLRVPVAQPTPLPVHLTMYYAETGASQEVYNLLANQFMTAHPGVTLELIQVPFEEFEARVELVCAAGTCPDILLYNWSNNLYNAGIYAPLDPWYTPSTLAQVFEPAVVTPVIRTRQVYGLPANQEGVTLIYNRQLVQGIGLPPQNDLDDLLTKAFQFRAAHPGKYYVCHELDSYFSAPIFFGFGMYKFGGYVDAAPTAYMDTPEALNAARWLAQERFYALGTTDYTCDGQFAAGNVALRWAGTWEIDALRASGMDYGFLPMGNSFVSGRVFSLGALPGAQPKAMSFEAISFFTGKEAQKHLALNAHQVPSLTSAVDDPQVQAIPDIAAFAASLRNGVGLVDHRFQMCQWGPVQDAVVAIWNGTLTPEQAVKQAQTEIVQCFG